MYALKQVFSACQVDLFSGLSHACFYSQMQNIIHLKMSNLKSDGITAQFPHTSLPSLSNLMWYLLSSVWPALKYEWLYCRLSSIPFVDLFNVWSLPLGTWRYCQVLINSRWEKYTTHLLYGKLTLLHSKIGEDTWCIALQCGKSLKSTLQLFHEKCAATIKHVVCPLIQVEEWSEVIPYFVSQHKGTFLSFHSPSLSCPATAHPFVTCPLQRYWGLSWIPLHGTTYHQNHYLS